MELALRRSSSRSREPVESPTKQLEDSIKNFEAILSESDRTWLKRIKAVPDADAVMVFTAELDVLNRQKKGRSIGTRLHGALQSIRDFTAVIDTFVSSHPEIAALVWGSVKLTMLLVANYVSYFEAISGLFMRFKPLCPRFEEYHALFPTSQRLQQALCNFNAAIVRCCKHVVEALQRSKKKQLLNALLQSFDTEFAPDVAEIGRLSREVKEEVLLAKVAADDQHQKLQNADAAETKKSLLSVFSISKKAADDLNEMRLQRDQFLLRQERLEALKAVSSYDHQKPFKEACQKRHYNTAEWMFSTTQFQRWKCKERSSVLWCSGKIGTGKTIITASVIDHIARTKPNNARVAYHFAQYNDLQSLQAETIVRSIIRQLLDINNLPKEIEMKFKFMDLNLISKLEDWLTFLRAIIPLSVCYIFVDGLDDCHIGEQRKLLDAFSSLANAFPELWVFISGRLSLSKEMARVFPEAERLVTSSADAAADISIYIKEALQGKIELEDLIIDDSDLILEIEGRLLQHADGMFLWVTYLIDELCTQRCDEDIRQALKDLPKNLEETFNRVLSRITGPRQAMAQKVFPWIAVAKRNLTIDELCQAASLNIGQKFLNESPRLQSERIIPWCENLLHLDEEYQTVQFAHGTIHDFITSERPESKFVDFHVNTKMTDHFAGEICLTFMHLNDFVTTVARRTQPKPARAGITPGGIAATSISHQKSLSRLMNIIMEPKHKRKDNSEKHNIRPYIQNMAGYERADESVKTLADTYPFWRYVSEHWLAHTAQFTHSSQTFKLWEHVIRDGHGIAETPWCGKKFERSKIEMFEWAFQNRHRGLMTYILTVARLSGHVKKKAAIALASEGDNELLDVLFSFTKSSEVLNTALLEACANGHVDTVDRVLQAGADVETSNHNGTALTIACLSGYINIVSKLLAANALVWPYLEESGYTPLQAAANKGNMQIVRVLLNLGADPNDSATDDNGHTALQAACKEGHITFAQYLISEQGVGVNAPPASVRGRTALQAACGSGNARLVELLLESGADLHAPPCREHGRTAIQAACEGGHFDITDKLRRLGADIHSLGVSSPSDAINGLTALQAASAGGNLDIVLNLIEHGARDEATGPWDTALRQAAGNGHMNIVSTLVQKFGSDDDSNAAALYAAANGGHLEVVEFFLALGGNFFRPPTYWQDRTALQAAAEKGHLQVVESLLAKGAHSTDVPSDKDGRTALQAASGSGHLDVVRRLLLAGADVNALPARHYGTRALEAASRGGHFQIVKGLLAAGADLNARNADGGTALHAACYHGQLDIVGLLMDEGADLWIKHDWFGLPIEHAARSGHVEAVELLYPGYAGGSWEGGHQFHETLKHAKRENHIEVVEFLSGLLPANSMQ